jgi:hypothetical protein
MVVVQRDADFVHVVQALHAAGAGPDSLHGGNEQRDQNGDDGDHDQQLDERECAPQSSRFHGSPPESGKMPVNDESLTSNKPFRRR